MQNPMVPQPQNPMVNPMVNPAFQQNQMLNQQQQQQPQQIQAQNPADFDPIAKFQSLVFQLNESLKVLLKVAAQVLYTNAQADNCVKSSEGFPQRVDKCLEDFYSICDQIELTLRLAVECSAQNADSNKNTPVPVQGRGAKGPDGQEKDSMPYATYLNTVKIQVKSAQEIHDALLECVRKISDKTPLQPATTTAAATLQQQQQPQQPQQQQGQQTT